MWKEQLWMNYSCFSGVGSGSGKQCGLPGWGGLRNGALTQHDGQWFLRVFKHPEPLREKSIRNAQSSDLDSCVTTGILWDKYNLMESSSFVVLEVQVLSPYRWTQEPCQLVQFLLTSGCPHHWNNVPFFNRAPTEVGWTCLVNVLLEETISSHLLQLSLVKCGQTAGILFRLLQFETSVVCAAEPNAHRLKRVQKSEPGEKRKSTSLPACISVVWAPFITLQWMSEWSAAIWALCCLRSAPSGWVTLGAHSSHCNPRPFLFGLNVRLWVVLFFFFFLHIGGRDSLLWLCWMWGFLFSSVRGLPSCDLSYFCSVPRGRNGPSINISVVISAGRPRVTFRKMSWNQFLTFISQSEWGPLLSRRVFIHPTRENILKWKGYSLSARGLAPFFVTW